MSTRAQIGAVGARILLVDDNADMREYLHGLLAEPYVVETAADGRAALESVRSHRPELILTDVIMPVMDGFELLRAMRADPSISAIPVILLAPRAGEEPGIVGLEAGAGRHAVRVSTLTAADSG